MPPRRPLQLALLALTALLFAPRARALDWAVVPYGVPEPGAATRAAEKVSRALVDRRVNVASMHEVKDLMLSRSRQVVRADPKDAAQISALRRDALEHAAMGRRDAARKAGEAALAIAAKAPETLLSDSDVARETFDACLAIVRVDLQEHNRERALADARRCRALVPDLTPKESSHPAGVIGVLAEAENELRRAGAAPLTISSSEGRECVVFVNGRRLGTAPFTLDHAPLGRIAVALQCGSTMSRVHLVELGDVAQSLVVDADHDTRISDRDVLGLVYRSEAELAENLPSDAVQMGAALRAQQLILVRAVRQGPVNVVRYDVARRRVVACVEMDSSEVAGTNLTAFREAADALALERIEAPIPPAFTARALAPASVTVAPPEAEAITAPRTAAKSETQPQEPHPAAPPSRKMWWTLGFGSAGLVAAAVGTGFAFASAGRARDFDECIASEAARSECTKVADDGRRAELTRNLSFGAAGALAAATVASFMVERRERSPIQVVLKLSPQSLTALGRF